MRCVCDERDRGRGGGLRGCSMFKVVSVVMKVTLLLRGNQGINYSFASRTTSQPPPGCMGTLPDTLVVGKAIDIRTWCVFCDAGTGNVRCCVLL